MSSPGEGADWETSLCRAGAGAALGRAVLRGGKRISKEGCPVFKAQWRLPTYSYKICSRSEFSAWAPRGVMEGSLMVNSPCDRQSQGLAFTRSFKDHHLLLWGPPPVSMRTTEGGWLLALMLLKVPTLNLRVGVPGVEFSEVVFWGELHGS